MLSKNPPVLGILAIGRGNDFAFGAGIPSDLSGCVDLLADAEPKPLDIGRVVGGDYPAGRYFGNGIGIGFDTIVGLEAARMKRIHGFMAYVLGALKTLAVYPEAPAVRLSFNETVIERKSHQISIMNGKRMGGTFFMAPWAIDDDGLLDLCMADRMTRRQMIGLMIRYTKGTQEDHPLVTTARAPRYEIEATEGGLVVHADGETICINGSSISVECIPHALRIFSGIPAGVEA
jgi:diacylglycerol kinase family enzyme